MAKDEVKIQWSGLEELSKEFKDMAKDFEKEMLEEYTKLGLYAEGGARKLSPRDSGDLEQSITFSKAQKNGEVIEVVGGTNLDYALKQHELPPGSIGGPRTQSKSSWNGYQPGRKYLENAVRGSEAAYDKLNVQLLDKLMKGKG